jgi:hypothetical protein
MNQKDYSIQELLNELRKIDKSKRIAILGSNGIQVTKIEGIEEGENCVYIKIAD